MTTILLVEDDRTIASALEYSLQQEHYATILCSTAGAAKEMIAQMIAEIDLCLFDLSMPDGSGYDLCKMVKEKKDIPVIFLTVVADEVNVIMGLDMGADSSLPMTSALPC